MGNICHHPNLSLMHSPTHLVTQSSCCPPPPRPAACSKMIQSPFKHLLSPWTLGSVE